MQPIEEIDKSYASKDPWGYQTNPEDLKRKAYILHWLRHFGPFTRALDIGAGEGWITKDIPAERIYGYEVSDNAAWRFPPNVTRTEAPEGKYDLVMATGVFYAHYAWRKFERLIQEHSSKYILLCNIKAWEVKTEIPGKQLIEMEFPYREYIQKLRIYEITS